MTTRMDSYFRHSGSRITVVSTDDELSAVECAMAHLRTTMWAHGGFRAEQIDNLTAGLTESPREIPKYVNREGCF